MNEGSEDLTEPLPVEQPPARSLVRSQTTPLDFILRHRVFTLEELHADYALRGRPQKAAREALKYHLARGRISRVRRGVYAHNEWVDPWVIASKLANHAVISHDGALSFHELTGVGHSVSFMTTERVSQGLHAEVIFAPVRVDQARLDWADASAHQRDGHSLFVTSLEATLVDCLALLTRSPPLDELMEVFKEVKRRASMARMVKHALRYESPLLCSRLGFFITCADHRLEQPEYGQLKRACAQRLVHFQRSTAKASSDRAFPPWNIVVPWQLYRFLPGA